MDAVPPGPSFTSVHAAMPRKKSLPCAVDLYAPLVGLDRFHRSSAKWRLLVGSNRSGKTLAAAIEFLRAILGKDPYQKYRPDHGLAIVIGLDSDHLAMLWRKLTIPGAFFVVPEGNTLRPVRIIDDNGRIRIHPEDEALRQHWKPAPPLLSEDLIEQVAWADKARKVPRLVHIGPTKWQVLFLTSQGEIKQGEHYDLVWIDEQIRNEQFFWEAVRGIVDLDAKYKSLGVWSATSQRQNPLLWELAQKALVSDEVDQYTLRIDQNPFIPDEEKRLFAEMLPEQERNVRVEGQFALEMWRIYPDFDPYHRHTCEPFPIPYEWTRYMAVDPGLTTCATVFGAVPPDGKTLYVYDELVVHNADARQWAERLAGREDAQMLEACIIDSRAGRSRGMGYALQVAQCYFEAMQLYGIKPRVIGPLAGWLPGCDNPDLRRERLRNYFWNTDREDAIGPGIKLFKGNTLKLIHQLQLAQFDAKNPKKRIQGEFDLVDALEYLVAAQPTYVPKPQLVQTQSRSIWEYYMMKQRKRNLRKLFYEALGYR